MLMPFAAAHATTKLAMIGDSITHGTGTNPISTMNYPTQLANLLASSTGSTTAWNVKNMGVVSATLMNTPASIRVWRNNSWTSLVSYAPNVVVITLGTNDAEDDVWAYNAVNDPVTGLPVIDPITGQPESKFLDEYRKLVDDIRALPTHPTVYVATPPPLRPDINGGTRLADQVDATRIDGLRAILPLIAELATEKGLTVLDYNTAIPSINAIATSSAYFTDRWHPNNAGAAILANTAFQAIPH